MLFVIRKSDENNRTQILVTHHVELVLPGAYYLVRMLDGRIDTQGILTELHAQGVLEDIANSEEVKVQEDQQDAAAGASNAEEIAAKVVEGGDPAIEAKKPRKLVKDEERQEGGVEWSVYNTYLKASYVQLVTALISCFHSEL
jgi:energy-coupling factor transporter ATP-binding protein EcfA2